MRYRRATLSDSSLLARLNQQLIRDEGHRNPMTVSELETRMRTWLAGEYEAVIFEDGPDIVAYAAYSENDREVYLRHFFVVRHRRREGIGRKAMGILRDHVWPSNKRLPVEVLWNNATAIAFWKALGCREYSLALEIVTEEKGAGARFHGVLGDGTTHE